MSANSEGESIKVLAKLLDTVEFPMVMKIVDQFENGRYDILPFITKIQSSLDTISPYNLTKCCRVQTLILPRCTNLSDNVLMMLPNLESLTIRTGTELTGEAFGHLNYLTKLQILSVDTEYDTMLTPKIMAQLGKLEMLHVRNDLLNNDCFRHLSNLKVLIIDGTNKVTPAILNYLPKIEVCIINKVLCKFISSTRNNAIIKKIGKLKRVRIYAIENN